MKSTPETAAVVLQEVLPVLEAHPAENWTNDSLFESLKGFIQEKGYKNGYVLWPVRIAVSGRSVTPAGATEILEILGKEESLARIRTSIEKLSK
jgi:glutamyl-tRNA synthetase